MIVHRTTYCVWRLLRRFCCIDVSREKENKSVLIVRQCHERRQRTYAHTHARTCARAHIYMNTHVREGTFTIHTHMRAHTHTSAQRTLAHMHTHARKHVRARTRTHSHMHIPTYAHTNARAHDRRHVRTQIVIECRRFKLLVDDNNCYSQHFDSGF